MVLCQEFMAGSGAKIRIGPLWGVMGLCVEIFRICYG